MTRLRKKSLSDLHAFFEDAILPSPMRSLGWSLAADVYQDNGNVIVEMHMPGIDPDRIDISVEGNVLHVAGEREEKIESEDRAYYTKEIKRGSFERVIDLPFEVQGDAARAESRNGELRILLPKKEGSKATKVKVS